MEFSVPVAVLAIDLQNGIFAGETLVHDAGGVLERAQEVIAAAAKGGHPVIVVQDDAGPGIWQPDTFDWEVHPRISAPPDAIRLRKRFGDAFRGTRLDEYLRDSSVGHVVVLGAMTDFSVRATLQRALLKGYRATLVVDAHSTLDAPDGTAVEQVELLNREIEEAEVAGLHVRGVTAEMVASALMA